MTSPAYACPCWTFSSIDKDGINVLSYDSFPSTPEDATGTKQIEQGLSLLDEGNHIDIWKPISLQQHQGHLPIENQEASGKKSNKSMDSVPPFLHVTRIAFVKSSSKKERLSWRKSVPVFIDMSNYTTDPSTMKCLAVQQVKDIFWEE